MFSIGCNNSDSELACRLSWHVVFLPAAREKYSFLVQRSLLNETESFFHAGKFVLLESAVPTSCKEPVRTATLLKLSYQSSYIFYKQTITIVYTWVMNEAKTISRSKHRIFITQTISTIVFIIIFTMFWPMRSSDFLKFFVSNSKVTESSERNYLFNPRQ